MYLERTISQLDIGPIPPVRAAELGQLGYMQWLGCLPGHLHYPTEAKKALAMAEPFRRTSPAIAAFCDLLVMSMAGPSRPLPVSLPKPGRRGGADARRLSL